MPNSKAFKRSIEANGNSICFRQLESLHLPMHSHDSVQVIIPMENSHFDITWELENKDCETKSLGTNSICLIPPLLEHEAHCSEGSVFVNFNIDSGYIRDHIKPGFDSQNDIFETMIGFEDRFIFHLGQSIRHHLLHHAEDKRVDIVLIGGRYEEAQRQRIREVSKARFPNCIMTEPGVDYPYSNENIREQTARLIERLISRI